MNTPQIVDLSKDQQFYDIVRKFDKNSPELISFLASIAAAYINEYPEKEQETDDEMAKLFEEYPIKLICKAYRLTCELRGKFENAHGDDLLENTIAYFKRYFKRYGITEN